MLVCKFDCKRCGVRGVSFSVRGRESEEDLIKWMNEVVRVGMRDAHKAFAPHCDSGKCDLMIPCPKGSEWIGQDLGERK